MPRRRRKRTRRKSERQLPRPLVWLLFLLGFLVVTWYVASLPIWQIQSVVVNGAKLVSDNEVRTLTGIPLYENLFFADLSRARANLKKITAIKDFRLYRLPPSTILIKITERQPMATVVFKDNSVVIDEDGIILNRGGGVKLNIQNLADLPLITGLNEAKYIENGKIKPQTAQVIAEIVLKLLKYLDSRIQLNLANFDNISFRLDDLLEVKVGNIAKLKRKMKVFGALTPIVADRWSKVEYVDIRIPDNPVIKYR